MVSLLFHILNTLQTVKSYEHYRLSCNFCATSLWASTWVSTWAEQSLLGIHPRVFTTPKCNKREGVENIAVTCCEAKAIKIQTLHEKLWRGQAIPKPTQLWGQSPQEVSCHRIRADLEAIRQDLLCCSHDRPELESQRGSVCGDIVTTHTTGPCQSWQNWTIKLDDVKAIMLLLSLTSFLVFSPCPSQAYMYYVDVSTAYMYYVYVTATINHPVSSCTIPPAACRALWRQSNASSLL